MVGMRDKPEEMVLKLRKVEVLQGQGMGIAEAVRQIGVTQLPIGWLPTNAVSFRNLYWGTDSRIRQPSGRWGRRTVCILPSRTFGQIGKPRSP